jgi:asparagine synthase (glutamine-hydrolysing)
MCGIFALLNSIGASCETISQEFMKGQRRGPEFSKLDTNYIGMTLGFHRLAINGLNEASNQPLVIDDVVLICNGEIYNYKQLYKDMGVEPVTGSDCEVIIHLYRKYGIEQTLLMLDGVYAFVLYDNRSHPPSEQVKQVFVARDPLGVRPLYYFKPNSPDQDNHAYGFASELKCLEHFYNTDIEKYSIGQFKPGTYSGFTIKSEDNSRWVSKTDNTPYFLPIFSHSWQINEQVETSLYRQMYSNIAAYLNAAVVKRCLTTERPVACLLSGGLDSSLITALVNNFYMSNNAPSKLETYSIGLYGSEDLRNARIVADYLGTKHTEIVVTEQQMFDAIPEVIRAIESYDTTTVRASIGNYLLGKYIAANSDAKVIFNGDGSDELLGGYLYMNKCPDDIEFDKETRRLLKDIHLFDVLRSDKSISSHGLEPRTPFLDRSFVNYMLSIPPYFRNHKNKRGMEWNSQPHDYSGIEKYLLRYSFARYFFTDYIGRQILPNEILWRKKEAFSDGVSSHGRSLFTIIQEHICEKLSAETICVIRKPSIEIEKSYYKKIFDEAYPNCSHILPYFWMPKYTDAIDPSARTLTFYSNTTSRT